MHKIFWALLISTQAYALQKQERMENHATLPVTEDLMREHGVLSRVLLIYEEAIRRIDAHIAFNPQVIHQAAGVIRTFIEEYHEVVEEKHIFPVLEQHKKLTSLIKTLRDQHTKGRAITSQIIALTQEKELNTTALRIQLKKFIRMYRPHEAREDTDVFPTFRSLVSHAEIERLGNLVEEIEEQTLGEGGFEKTVQRVADLEKELGIHKLEQFTS